MVEKEKEKLEIELAEVNKEIRIKEIEIEKSREYKILEDSENDLLRKKNEKDSEYDKLSLEVYKKYTHRTPYLNYYQFHEIKLNEIKSSVKQGIKIGLGAKNIKSIEDIIVRIVKGLIKDDFKNPQMEDLKDSISLTNKEISKLRKEEVKLLDDGLILLKNKKANIMKEINREKINEDKRMKKLKDEADIKMKELPKHLPKIISEINRRLILDGVNK